MRLRRPHPSRLRRFKVGFFDVNIFHVNIVVVDNGSSAMDEARGAAPASNATDSALSSSTAIVLLLRSEQLEPPDHRCTELQYKQEEVRRGTGTRFGANMEKEGQSSEGDGDGDEVNGDGKDEPKDAQEGIEAPQGEWGQDPGRDADNRDV